MDKIETISVLTIILREKKVIGKSAETSPAKELKQHASYTSKLIVSA